MSQELEDRIGHRFRRPDLLKAALTHKSYACERGLSRDNERLEFLGDSVLSAAVAHRLYELYQQEHEGGLSKRKALLVSRPMLAQWARDIGLGGDLYLGAGEAASGGRERPSILADALEALIGAVYLDGGYEAATRFILGWLERKERESPYADYKSRLQEIFQKRYKTPPRYEVTETTGPDHDKTFLVRVRMGKRFLGEGAGKNKKEAEQTAARDALGRLDQPARGPEPGGGATRG